MAVTVFARCTDSCPSPPAPAIHDRSHFAWRHRGGGVIRAARRLSDSTWEFRGDLPFGPIESQLPKDLGLATEAPLEQLAVLPRHRTAASASFAVGADLPNGHRAYLASLSGCSPSGMMTMNTHARSPATVYVSASQSPESRSQMTLPTALTRWTQPSKREAVHPSPSRCLADSGSLLRDSEVAELRR